MVNAIVPAAKAVYGKPGDFVDNTVRESAKRTTTKIATTSEIVSHLIKAGKVKVLAARYDLDDGRVEFDVIAPRNEARPRAAAFAPACRP